VTYEALYGDERVSFHAPTPRVQDWLPDGKHYLEERDGLLQRVDAETDQAEPAYDVEQVERTLAAHPDFTQEQAARAARNLRRFTPDRSAVLLRHDENWYVYWIDPPRVKKVAETGEPRREVTLSPDARYLGFVRENDLYVVETETGLQLRLTHDGSPRLLNGVLDWVYQEEVYGRGDWQAYWWREDSRYVAFLQLDESQVPEVQIADNMHRHPRIETMLYPKPGDPNPQVRLGIAALPEGKIAWVDLTTFDLVEPLVVRVAWAPDGLLIYQVQDREQRELVLADADPTTAAARVLIRESSPAWVDVLGQPHWLADRSFLWRSARDGWSHLYHYRRDGNLVRRITSGEREVAALHGVDEQAGLVYFQGSPPPQVENHAYCVPLAGGQPTQLTEPGVSHRVQLDPTFHYFVDTFSSATAPPRVELRRIDGTTVRVLGDGRVKALDEYECSPSEMLQIPARDGYLLNARLVRPLDFDPAIRYPVWAPVYAGPGATSVHNRWDADGFTQLLAAEGYLVWECDPRSASGRGEITAWQAYERLGATELDDIEDGLRWLIDQGLADPQRIGISGWSYGGYMAAYAVTHSTMFKLAIAGAPVTDWRNYDSIYTERFMRTPEHNPRGYSDSSVTLAAPRLHGRLLLVHGALDDNVHLQNSIEFIEELQQAGRQFDFMLYPRDRHGVGHGWRHYHELQWRYIRENL